MNIRILMLLCTATLSLSACGNNGGDLIEKATTLVTSNSQTLTPGVYKLTFAAFSTARLAAPISGIDVAVKLPAGLLVHTDSGGTGQVAVTSLTQGSAVFGQSWVLGNYSASTRTAYLSMGSTQDDFRSGQYMNLFFTVAAGTSVTPNDIYALNATYPNYKVIGMDTSAHSTVVLTGSVKTTLGIEH